MIHMENRNTETIKMMYLEDRPYEKCEQYGAEHLTDVELLAVLLRTGTKGENSLRLAQKILHPPFGSEGLLSIPQWSMEQLLKIKGIGKVKSIQILCLFLHENCLWKLCRRMLYPLFFCIIIRVEIRHQAKRIF